jgi:hypothetical protein
MWFMAGSGGGGLCILVGHRECEAAPFADETRQAHGTHANTDEQSPVDELNAQENKA